MTKRATLFRVRKILQSLLWGSVGLALVGALGVVVVLARRPPRTDLTEKLFQGVTYHRQVRSTPRPLMIHIVEVDLSAPGLHFVVTPGDKTSQMDVFAATTAEFLEKSHTQLAINGSFFTPFYTTDFTYDNYYPHSGDPVDVSGLAVSNGVVYSLDEASRSKLCLSATNAALITSGACPLDTTQALAGSRILAKNGVTAPASASDELNPRTAVAVNASMKKMWLMVVDGRQIGYSEGVKLDELADIALEFGAQDVLNLDGGGSSALVIADPTGPRVLNSPIHTRIPLRQRPVANHLGLFALPLNAVGD